MDEFKQRLLEFIEKFGTSVRSFEEECDLTNGTVGSIKAKGPGAQVVQKISYTHPELNLNWLFTGKGQMVNEGVSDKKSLPLIPIEAFAGPGEPNYEDERIQDYYTVTDFKESDFLLRVKGDSMVPKYNGGDIVACKKIDKSSLYFFQWGKVYVIYTLSQGAMIKRIQPSEKDGWIKCVSENVKYAPFDIPMEDVVSVALVNGSISLE